jgi:hypothetical protein
VGVDPIAGGVGNAGDRAGHLAPIFDLKCPASARGNPRMRCKPAAALIA